MGLMYSNKYPLTDMQNMMLFYAGSAEHANLYVVQMRAMLREEINFNSFQLAWNKIIARHEVLRAGIYGKEIDDALLAICVHVNFAVSFVDFSKYSSQIRQDKLDCLLRADLQQGFDLYHPPLMRVKLIKLSKKQYFLLWSHHHIILSSESSIKILHEVFEAYDETRKGEVKQLPQATAYGHFIDHLQQLDHTAARQYWRKICENFHPLPRLLFTGNEQSNMVIREIASTEVISISAHKLEQFCGKYDLLPNIVVHGVWGLLLSIYSNSTDVIFGNVRSFKSSINENLAGCFFNLFPVRSKINQSILVLDYLFELRSQYEGFTPHLGALLSNTQQHNDMPHFDAVVNFVSQTPGEFFQEIGGKWKNRKAVYIAETNYPLTLFVWKEEDGFNFRIDYAANFYEAEIIAKMLRHFKYILDDVLKNANQRVADVKYLSPLERKKILFNWNDTYVPYSFDKTVSQLFEEQVELVPNNIAVICGESKLTYLELNQKANRLARYIQKEFNFVAKTPIAVHVGRNSEMIIAMLAIFKAGFVYLPIDYDAPQERIKYIIKDAKVSLLISKDELDDVGCYNLVMDRDWEDICKKNSDNLPEVNDAAYIIYTSGSTGEPKGVMVLQNSLLNLVNWHCRVYKVNAGDKVTVLANESFDASIWEIMPHLLSGCTLHILWRDLVADSIKLAEYLQKHKITLSFLPTPIAELFFDIASNYKLALRYLLIGGDRLSKRPKENTFRVINHYGPTENTVCATCGEVLPVDAAHKSLPHIGKPIDNVKCYILDKMQRIVPMGVIGELYLGGMGLAEGYVGQPELTQQKFIDNPFSDVGGKLYKTGDLVRWLPDGNIDFIGRVDNQVKIRGYRIELSDIERNLEQYPPVKKCAVIVKNTSADAKMLVAYVVPQTHQAIDVDAIRLFLAKSIPHYMIPSVFYEVNELPLTSNGKIDKQKLSEQAVVSVAPKTLPKTATEDTILQILQKLLHVKDLSVECNFFEIGLNSLMVVQLCYLLNDRLEMNLRLVDIFTYHSVRLLAEYVDHKNDEYLYLAAIRQRVMKKRQRACKNRKRVDGKPGFNRYASNVL